MKANGAGEARLQSDGGKPRVMAARSLRELLPAEALMALGRSLNWDPRHPDLERQAREWTWREPERMRGGAWEEELWGRASGMGWAGRGSRLKKMEPQGILWSLAGPGGRVEQEGLPVFWSLTQSRLADEQDDRDVACLIFLAALRREPRGAEPARGLVLFGSFSFEGKASEAWGEGLEGPARGKCGVIASESEAEAVIQGLLGAGRMECASFTRGNPLWEALPEFVSPSFYERRALDQSVGAGQARGRAPGL